MLWRVRFIIAVMCFIIFVTEPFHVSVELTFAAADGDLYFVSDPYFRFLLIDMVSYSGHVFKKLSKPLYKWIPLSVYKTFFFKKKSLLDIRKMNYERKQLQCVVSAAVGEIECDQDAWRCAGLPFQIVMWHFPVFTVLLVISHQMAHLLELGTGTVSYILSCVYGSPSL